MTRIALAQTHCVLGDKAENLKRMEACLDQAEADIYVFAELFLTGYMCRDRLFRLAEAIDGRSVTRVAGMAEERECAIVFGMPTWSDEVRGLMHNSSVAVDPDGEVQVYDKVNLANFGPFEERFFFTPGESPAMFDLFGRKYGACICYDLFFPELAKAYALAGADAVLCISASPSTSREQFERILPARAVEGTMYALYTNQVGTQLNLVFFGGAQAYGPKGNLMSRAKYFEDDVVVVDLDEHELETARRMRPTIKDTLSRPDF
ncbi:MAG: carbon-nitrogen hydrolase family protein [Methanomassiliicoccales archaeon]|nr:carbon-nitrogen hydrolase family protein [Methanomassiliicoccales archaeon]